MPSLISQMRNGPQQMQTQLPIQQVKQLMNNIQMSQNPQAMLNNLIGQNPQLATLIQSGNLQQVAQQMAAEKGIDLNQLIQQLRS